MESNPVQIFHFIVFCLQKKSAAIGEIVQSAIRRYSDTKLLEECKGHYDAYSEKLMIDHINAQLSSNITTNSLNAVNRDDWQDARDLFNTMITLDSSKRFGYEKLKKLYDVSKTQLANGFTDEINK